MANGSSRDRGRRAKKNTAPARPAAVSGPGRLSRRTDSVAPSIEDVRGMVSESAGEEAALVEQVRQGTIPGEEGTQPQTQVTATPQPLQPMAPGVADIFTEGDGTPITTPSSMQQQESTLLEPDDLMLIRAMAQANPTAELISLLQFASQKINRTPQQFG
jgi:hypothetical protein